MVEKIKKLKLLVLLYLKWFLEHYGTKLSDEDKKWVKHIVYEIRNIPLHRNMVYVLRDFKEQIKYHFIKYTISSKSLKKFNQIIGKEKGRMGDVENRIRKLRNIWEDKEEVIDRIMDRVRFDGKLYQALLAIKLMRATGMRVGNEGNATAGEPTYGTITLLKRHFVKEGGKYYLKFLGKKGVKQVIELPKDLGRQIEELIERRKKNDPIFDKIDYYYIRKIIDRHIKRGIKPHDFRHLKANEVALQVWDDLINKKKAYRRFDKRTLLSIIKQEVSKVLGNTPSVAYGTYFADSLKEWMDRELDKLYKKGK